MTSRKIFDVKIIIINENIFHIVLQAEIKYCNVLYPFISKLQARGIALRKMGIQTNMGEMPKVSKLLPFTYQREITEPRKRWESRYIQLIFTPVISTAEKLHCITKNKSLFTTLNFQMAKAEGHLQKSNIYDTSMEKLSSKNEETVKKQRESTTLEPTSPEGNVEIYQEYCRNSCLVQSSILHLNRERIKYSLESQITTITNTKSLLKSSESKAMILWPFQLQNTSKYHKSLSSQKHSHETYTSVPASRLESPKPKKHLKRLCIKESKIKRHKNVKKKENADNIDHDKEASKRKNKENISRKQASTCGNSDLLVESENNSLIGNSETHQKGFLIGLFNAAAKKRLFPENITPIIKVRDTTSNSSQDIL